MSTVAKSLLFNIGTFVYSEYKSKLFLTQIVKRVEKTRFYFVMFDDGTTQWISQEHVHAGLIPLFILFIVRDLFLILRPDHLLVILIFKNIADDFPDLIVCIVCKNGDTTTRNEIVLCDSCNCGKIFIF